MRFSRSLSSRSTLDPGPSAKTSPAVQSETIDAENKIANRSGAKISFFTGSNFYLTRKLNYWSNYRLTTDIVIAVFLPSAAVFTITSPTCCELLIVNT